MKNLSVEPEVVAEEAPTRELAAASLRKGQPAPAVFELLSFLLRAAELLALTASAFVLARVLLDEDLNAERTRIYVNAVVIAAVFYAGLAEVTGSYDVDVRFSVRRAWSRVLTAWLATSLFMLTMGFLFKISDTFSRVWAISWFFAGGASICAARAAVTWWMRRLKMQGVFNQRVAIFGAGLQGIKLAEYISGNDKLTIDIVGFFDDRPRARLDRNRTGIPLIGNLKALVKSIRGGAIDQVIIAMPWSTERRLQDVVAQLAVTPVRIRLAPDLASFAFTRRPLVMLGDLPVMTLFERPISGTDQLVKKLEDLLLGVLITALLLPVFAVVALLIRIDSPGPVFFRQPREGFNNRPFRIWKFRSMHANAEQVDDIQQATRNDSRVTRVGRILRRTSLDELPQLFNVLTGEMSLVGPRPHAASTKAGDRLFSEVVTTYAARHKVKPGITGWAQVCGWRGETDTEDKLQRRVEHDLYYIENWSVMFDLYVLIRTSAALFSSRAY
jgi:polysaccharide biosynthesis protein PslA